MSSFPTALNSPIPPSFLSTASADPVRRVTFGRSNLSCDIFNLRKNKAGSLRRPASQSEPQSHFYRSTTVRVFCLCTPGLHLCLFHGAVAYQPPLGLGLFCARIIASSGDASPRLTRTTQPSTTQMAWEPTVAALQCTQAI